MKHFIDINHYDRSTLSSLFTLTDTLRDMKPKKRMKQLRHKTIMQLFFENSTRTRVSFELAARRLGAHLVNIDIARSSTQKGESLRDTLETLAAMGCDAFVIRHANNGTAELARKWLGNKVSIINAGDGNHQHPTQALLDLYTIHLHKGGWKNLKIGIFGDIKHSRVAASLIDGLRIMGCHDINLYGPRHLMPESTPALMVNSFANAARDADVLVMLRIQKERMADTEIPNPEQYLEYYGLTPERLKLAKPDAIVMHPGPINREVEIASEVADGPQSVILEQVTNGVLTRQAILHHLLA